MTHFLGDLLRDERNSPGSEYGELIENHITNGTIVPVAITCSLLERAMNKSEKNDFLIDGFPRYSFNLKIHYKIHIELVAHFGSNAHTSTTSLKTGSAILPTLMTSRDFHFQKRGQPFGLERGDGRKGQL